MTLNYLSTLAVGAIALALFLLYLFRTVRFKKSCPNCGNPHPDRVARPKLMRRVPSKAYHCTACGKRYYQLGIVEKSTSLSMWIVSTSATLALFLSWFPYSWLRVYCLFHLGVNTPFCAFFPPLFLPDWDFTYTARQQISPSYSLFGSDFCASK